MTTYFLLLKLVFIQRFNCIVLRLYKLNTSLIIMLKYPKISNTIYVRYKYITQIEVSISIKSKDINE